ncbi:MAG TPA: 3' terminal RNA ribose 2'-O-methyltransferase Hen1, partial [Abditibacterium sp.]
LAQYVNDRPYVASSFLSVAVAGVLRSALNGVCKELPELATLEIPLEIQIEGVPCSEETARNLFEPLDYEVSVEKFALNGNSAWGDAPFVRLHLKTRKKLSEMLAHLYVLLPVMDDDKHYYIGEDEVEKLLKRGEGWLENHPQKSFIVSRYLKRQKRLVFAALEKLAPESEAEVENDEQEEKIEAVISEKTAPLHQIRIETVLQTLKASGAKRVLDLGCGEGRLLRELLKDRQFEEILGLDASHRALEIASDKLKLERLPELKRDKIRLIHGALTYRDDRLKGYDAAALVEVIEHLDAPRLHALERAVWEFARPDMVVLTTPNAEYNVRWESLPAGKMRHRDHRFEWNRAQFRAWAQKVADDYGYEIEISDLGPSDEEVGAPSQMGVWKRKLESGKNG